MPPGPIANPGRASLEATANPARTRDLFFVADGSGGHAFTETYDQHARNVAKLRTMEKAIQNDTVEPAEEAHGGRRRAPAPADANAGNRRPPARPAPPQKRQRAATPPARQGAAQSATTTPPVVQQ